MVVLKPAEFTFTAGLLAGVGAAMAAAAGSIFVKRVELTTIPLQAWIGLFSWPPLLIASLIFERGQIEAMVLKQAQGRINWLVGSGGDAAAALVGRMHARGRVGPLWEHLAR